MVGADFNNESYKTIIRNQIASSVASIRFYAAYFKQIGSDMVAWAAQNAAFYANWVRLHMGAGVRYVVDSLTYLFLNFRQIATKAFNVVISWLVKGFWYGYRAGAYLLNKLADLIRAIPKILNQLYHAFVNELKFLKEVGIFVLKGLKHMMLNLRHYLGQLLNAGIKIAKDIANNIVPFLKALWRVVKTFAKDIAHHAWKFFTWAATGISKRFFMGIGMLYGFSAVLVETLCDGINYLALKTLGVNLAGLAAFSTAQTLFSVALAAFIAVQAVRFSLYAMSGIFALSFFQRQPQALSGANNLPNPQAIVVENENVYGAAGRDYVPDYRRRRSANAYRDEAQVEMGQRLKRRVA